MAVWAVIGELIHNYSNTSPKSRNTFLLNQMMTGEESLPAKVRFRQRHPLFLTGHKVYKDMVDLFRKFFE